jgi:hypothetical protein
MRAASLGTATQTQIYPKMNEARLQGRNNFSDEEMASIRNDAAQKGLQSLTPSELAQHRQFRASPAGQRFFAAQRLCYGVTKEWIATMPAKTATINAAAIQAAQDFISRAR